MMTMTFRSADADEPSAPGPAAEREVLRTVLREVLQRIDQVRSALAADHRALDDHTLCQMLDMTDAWAVLERFDARMSPPESFTKDGD